MKITKWITGTYDEAAAKRLGEELSLPSLASKLLVSRGITSADAARAFIKKEICGLYDPFLLSDMDKAVARLRRAIEKGELIAVYGDYDADGVTSTFIMLHYLKSIGANCVYHIPDRLSEGYGVAESALRELASLGVSLIVTVDTGITAIDEMAVAKDLGIDVIITDHHKCGDVLPAACAVVNPNRTDCTYPFSGLAGVGVAFKLISAMCGNDEDVLRRYLPYACIGTVADVMPLVDENRIIVALGLELLPVTESYGLSALLENAGSSKNEQMSAGAIGFLVGPRINAAGRMGSAVLALELLFAKDPTEANLLAEKLGEKNCERRQCESGIMDEVYAKLDTHPECKGENAIVIDGDGWHQGVLGIVASRICNQFGLPSVLISADDGECRGSGRSVPGVSLHKAFCQCADIVEKFGGHDLAAGVVIKRENIAEFRRRLNEALAEDMREYTPFLEIDFVASPEELTIEQLDALRVMEPYGKMNEAPLLCMRNCKVSRITPIGGGRHLKIAIEHGKSLQCVYFGKTQETIPFCEGDYIDIAFTPEINTYNGRNVQLHIKDARPCEEKMAKIEDAWRKIDAIKHGDVSGALFVEYSELGTIWRAMTRTDFPLDAPITAQEKKLCSYDRTITLYKFFTALEIFSELGLLGFESENLRVHISIADHNNKVDLKNSKIYNALSALRS